MTNRSRALALYALVCYVLSVAIVPAGFMAAPVESGAAFHLCPGDARSAQIIDAFDGDDPHHHHHHAQQQDAAPSADLDCGFAGAGTDLLVASAAIEPADFPVHMPSSFTSRNAWHTTAWLRPPARSPPA